MHFHLPKPLHGWREFVGEVGIIVVGVLIALGAQQLVETANWRHEVAGFRDAVRDELEENLDTYPSRARQEACIHARLDELQQWLDGWRSGRGVKLTGPIGIAASRSIRTSVWNSTDPAVLGHVPRDERIGYSFLYNEFANNEVHRLDEREAWIELAGFDGATMLDHQDQMRLQTLLARARLRDQRIQINAGRFLKRAASEYGLVPKPVKDPPVYDPRLCVPILPQGEGRANR